jgi:hypothetical protein
MSRVADVVIIGAVLLLTIMVGGRTIQAVDAWWGDLQAWLDAPMVYADGPRDASVCVSSELKTLWHIAREYYPGRHTGEMVEEIRKANPHLDPGKLQIGQVVVLP